MSLKVRLSLAMVAVIAVSLMAMIMSVLFAAKPRLAAENDSIMRLTQSMVQSSLVALESAQDPKAAVMVIVDRFRHLRHAEVSLKSSAAPSFEPDTDRWNLGRIIDYHPQPAAIIPVLVKGKQIGAIEIKPRPADELSEIVEAIRGIAGYGVAMGLAAIALTLFVVGRALKPLEALAHAIRGMQAGNYAVPVKPAGPPEIATITSHLRDLAAALRKSTDENALLSAHLIEVQDQERREIARELHDELGPHLFTLRAAAASLERELKKPLSDPAKALGRTREIVEHVDALQKTNSRVLKRLSPIGLRELGLERSLAAMADMWRRSVPSRTLELHACAGLDDLDEARKLTVYRIVQEGLTNAYRHSNARMITATAEIADDGSVAVRIEDDGDLSGSGLEKGFGLRAMRERLTAMGGTLSIEQKANGGVALKAHLPAAHPAPDFSVKSPDADAIGRN
jgi:two-component system sensor histidine kinase UhpB